MGKKMKMFLVAAGVVVFGAFMGFLNGQFGEAPVAASTLAGGGIGFLIDAIAGGIVYLYYEVLDEILGDEDPDWEFSKTPFFVSLGCLSASSLIGFLIGFFGEAAIGGAVLIGTGVGTLLALLVSALVVGILFLGKRTDAV